MALRRIYGSLFKSNQTLFEHKKEVRRAIQAIAQQAWKDTFCKLTLDNISLANPRQRFTHELHEAYFKRAQAEKLTSEETNEFIQCLKEITLKYHPRPQKISLPKKIEKKQNDFTMSPLTQKWYFEIMDPNQAIFFKSAKEMLSVLEQAKNQIENDSKSKIARLIYEFALKEYHGMFKYADNSNSTPEILSTLSDIRAFIAACLAFLADELDPASDPKKQLDIAANRYLPGANKPIFFDQIRQRVELVLIDNDIALICQKSATFISYLEETKDYLNKINLSESKDELDPKQLHQLKLIVSALHEFANSNRAIEQPRCSEAERKEQAMVDLQVAAGCVSYFIDKMKTIVTTDYLSKKLSDLENILPKWQAESEQFIENTTIKKQLDDQIALLTTVTRDSDAFVEAKELADVPLLNSDGTLNEENVRMYGQKLSKRM